MRLVRVEVQSDIRRSGHEVTHTPVMLDEMLKALAPIKDGYYADVTYGCGGYSRAIGAVSGIKLFASDRDPCAVEIGRNDVCVDMYHAKFSELNQFIAPNSLDGLVADLGMSSPQVDDVERGFSFNSEGPLDMRMGLCAESALDLIRYTSEEQLALILRVYGEEPRAKAIARALVQNRDKLHTTQDLVRVVAEKTWHPKRHPATRTFQALRIAVNDELQELDYLMRKAKDWVKEGGRVVVVSFHSLEDRIVKRALKAYGCSGRVFPSDTEVARNPRARSAVLRWAEVSRIEQVEKDNHRK